MWLVLDLVYLLAAAAYVPILLYQRFVHGKRRGGWREKLGRLPPRPHAAPCIWVHAVSLGEANAARTLIQALREELPDRPVVVSTTTDTGFARARELYPDLYVFRYPLDFSWVVARVLRSVRPALIVLMELEVWPNLVALAQRRGVPIAVVNGRITEQRSMRRYGLPIARQVARYMFSRIAWAGAQNATYAERFAVLGVPRDRIAVAGMLKWDTAQAAPAPSRVEALRAALRISPERPVWVCGQTGPGEEAVVLDAYRRLRERTPGLQLVVVPRKPERFDEVAAMVERQPWSSVRRSRYPDAATPPAEPPDVVVGDTIGELRHVYALADVVFVGRSLVAMGGSDVMEVAALARPILVGPHMENFADSVAALAEAEAIRVLDVTADQPDAAARLATEVGALLDDRDRARRMGEAAQRVVVQNQGATRRTVAALRELVHRAQP